MKKKNEKLEDLILYAEKNFPKEFKNMIPCRKFTEHDWFMSPKMNLHLVDVECKNCKTNLAIALKLFAGMQDHA